MTLASPHDIEEFHPQQHSPGDVSPPDLRDNHVNPVLLQYKCTLSQDQTQLLVHELFYRFILPYISEEDIGCVMALKDCCMEWRQIVLQEKRFWVNWQSAFHRDWLWSVKDVEYFVSNNKRALYGRNFPDLERISKKQFYNLEDMGILRRDLERARIVVRRRNNYWDLPRFLVLMVCQVVLFMLGGLIVFFLLMFGLSAAIWDVQQFLWIFFVAYALMVLWNVIYVSFAALYVMTFDWAPAGFNLVRKSKYIDERFFKYCGLSSDTKERKWMLLRSDFVMHLLWLPLALILFTVKAAVDLEANYWSYFALPVYAMWILYIVSCFINTGRTCFRIAYPKFDGSIMTGMAVHYLFFSVLVVIFYGGLCASSVMLLGTLDDFFDFPVSVSLIPFEVACGIVICLGICTVFSQMLTCSCEEERSTVHKKLPAIESVTGCLLNVHTLMGACVAINFLMPVVVAFILTGLAADGGDIDWAWIFATPLIFIFAEILLFACITILIWPGVLCCAMICGVNYRRMRIAKHNEGRAGSGWRNVVQVTG